MATDRHHFQIGKRVRNPSAYSELCRIWREEYPSLIPILGNRFLCYKEKPANQVRSHKSMKLPLKEFLIPPEATVREALEAINRNTSIALVVDAERHLLGTVTDGDLRRSVLAGAKLESSVQSLLDRRDKSLYPKPITAPLQTPPSELLRLMNERGVRQIPLLDENEKIVDIALLQDLIKEYEVPLKAVIMAGGFGMRLRPLTDDVPKPMLPIGDKPVLELIVSQLHDAGISKVQLTTHYKPEVIKQHFGDGTKFGVEIQYLNEDQPLGTAGALGAVAVSEEPMLVLNGDVLTQVDFRAMVAFHREHAAELTVGVRNMIFRFPMASFNVTARRCGGSRKSRR